MQLKEVLRKDVIDMVLATDMKQVGGQEGEGRGCAVMLFPRYLPKFSCTVWLSTACLCNQQAASGVAHIAPTQSLASSLL